MTSVMARERLFYSTFYSAGGTCWQVEIMSEEGNTQAADTEVSMPWEEPLVIEWPETAKEAAVRGSMATVRLISTSDRMFAGLYTTRPGAVTLDVKREGELWWRGSMDTEFYEEPYSEQEGYVVTLMFSDMGVMERRLWSLTGSLTLREVLTACTNGAGLTGVEWDEQGVSTRVPDYPGSSVLDMLAVQSANFYDEEGEAMTLREVAEGVLKPIGLSMMQRAGRLWIYDLNGLAGRGAEAEEVEWMSDDQVMGTDKVYNNITIRWSPYVKGDVLSGTECWVKDMDRNETALGLINGKAYGSSTLYSYHRTNKRAEWAEDVICGFTLWTDYSGKGCTIATGARFAKVVAQTSGSETDAAALLWNSWDNAGNGLRHGHWADSEPDYPFYVHGISTNRVGGVLVKSDEARLEGGLQDGLLVRVSLDLLIDARPNFFEQAEWTQYDKWLESLNYIYVPVTIKYCPDGSESVYVWKNADVTHVVQKGYPPITDFSDTLGEWVPYDMSADDDPDPETIGYLCWYDAEDRTKSSAVGDWKSNRPAINSHNLPLSRVLVQKGGGQYLPYPTNGNGTMWVEVREKGWLMRTGTNIAGTGAMASAVEWIMTKLPQIEVVRDALYDDSLSTDDVIYKARLDSNARESLSMDTVCGTKDGGVPMARGAYMNILTGIQVERLTRSGRTATAEELLAGTIYSQYATRHTTLSGTVRSTHGGVRVMREACQEGKLLWMASEEMDVRSGESQVKLVELSADEYDKI